MVWTIKPSARFDFYSNDYRGSWDGRRLWMEGHVEFDSNMSNLDSLIIQDNPSQRPSPTSKSLRNLASISSTFISVTIQYKDLNNTASPSLFFESIL